MKKIENLASIAGRDLLRKIFRELRFEKQRSSIACLLITWRIAISDIEIGKYIRQEVNILHTLGFLKGTSLWLEEIVNRFYFSTVNSFVYFGAAILLVLIGIRRFSDNVSDEVVIWGIVFEATMLIFMFIIMLFSPSEELVEDTSDNEQTQQQELMTEVGEIGRDFAAALVQLETITDKMDNMLSMQNESIRLLLELVKATSDTAKPNTDMLKVMSDTNSLLYDFKTKITELVNTVDKINNDEIRFSVRKELETLLVEKMQSR